MKFLTSYRHVIVLVGITLLLTLLPMVIIGLVLGSEYRGFIPTFGDEPLYPAHVEAVVTGHLTDGNPYFIEHADGSSLVLFGGAWLNAIPFWLGFSFNTATYLNFIIWSALFALAFYWLLRELRVTPWVSVGATVALYLMNYAHVWRPINLQPVYPFFALFYIALARLLRDPSRNNMLLLALPTGAMFYLFSYLWQTFVITLGLLTLWALYTKRWPLFKRTLQASALGGVVGLPALIYIYWVSHTSPYFWESIARFGLVETHLPMGEVVYTGGWIGLVLAFVALLYWRTPLCRDSGFVWLCTFLCLSGLGLWIMQGSNVVTGKLLETGEHIRLFIVPWLLVATVALGAHLWRLRDSLSGIYRWVSVAAVVALVAASSYFTYYYFRMFVYDPARPTLWREQQWYPGPLEWIEANVATSSVVWINPHDYIDLYLPAMTRHYVLFSTFSMWQLVSQDEFVERYLVSQYFDNPSAATLRAKSEVYLGRQYLHWPPTIAREIAFCKLIHFWQSDPSCGTPKTKEDLLGSTYFDDLERRLVTDIRPNIRAYLRKYQVSYILKDTVLDPHYDPEALGAELVYHDARYRLYYLPQ